MNYTLYIDESGDFESQRGQWVLSGMLFADHYENCEKILTRKLEMMPTEFDLRSIKDFHLTEFRRDFGHGEAVDMAKRVFNRLKSLPFDYHCLAAINLTKSTLSNREKTYRLMLSDLLTLCETAVPESEVITHLDLVVASRTIDGEVQTSISNIHSDIIKSLPLALEVDLATKGMVDLIGKHIKVKMDYANNSWGLVCADFLANLNYHNRKKVEKQFLDELDQKGKYSLFESFGGFEIRRANIAERDKDYVLALYRWVIIAYGQKNSQKANESIQRLFFKIFNCTGTSGYIISFESIIERLWRSYNSIDKYNDLAEILNLFESQLIEYIHNHQDRDYTNFLFRLRNLMLIVENHLASTSRASRIASEQSMKLSMLASNPEYFQLILDFKIMEIEIFVNSLNFEKALYLSNKYSQMIENYKEVWQLLVEQDELDQFGESRANIKAEMTLFRCNILCVGINDHSISNDFIGKINQVGHILTNKIDISRFSNYKIMLLLKQKRSKEAVNCFTKQYNENNDIMFNAFDMLWFLRAINDALLSAKELDIKHIIQIIDSKITSTDLNTKGHPVDLILRELALLEFQLNNKSKALRYIKKSKRAFDLADSEISLWLQEIMNIHDDYIHGKMKESGMYFKSLEDSPFVKAINKSNLDLSFLERIRYFSPY